jgi:tetratricopeptide (TPR) repeat protein
MEGTMKDLYRAVLVLLVLCLLFSCTKSPILIPEFATATEQYIFAKSLKDKVLMEQPMGTDKKTHNQAMIMAYENVINRYPDDKRVTPLAWIDLGDAYFRLGEYEKALTHYDTAKQKYPEQDDILCKSLFGAARSHDKLKNFEQAIANYKECFVRYENDSRPYLAIIGQQSRVNYSRIRIK